MNRRDPRIVGVVLALLTLAAAGPAVAGEDPKAKAAETARSLQEIETQAEKGRARARALQERARELSDKGRALKAESVAVARRTQDLETELSQIEDTLADLERDAAAKRAALRRKRAQMAGTLAALQRIAVQPPEALALGPGSPLEVVRGAMLLRVAVPEIETRVARLRADLDELADLRRRIERKRTTMATTAEKLMAERRHLAELVSETRRLRREASAGSEKAAARARALAEEAADMRELVARLREQAEARAAALAARAPRPPLKPEVPALESTGDTARKEKRGAPAPRTTQTARLDRPSDIRPFPREHASLNMPARGRVVTRYGEHVEQAGGTTRSRGIAIATRPSAQVVAPYDGKVVYAGPFRGYGRILIIDHGGRYHSLLAGLERIDAIVGQWVLAGEPVGVMGGSRTRNPELYVELRRTGQPVNPLPWLAQTGDKVRG